ncbi:anthocyanidin reductase ((2S)-flavan-3-ol-forming)-like [Mercurialis annua]|uniref:anthocyanidin reductase ((2S)-flavan-3-ol-forming)-like n=1 Tax=Mercurialis annua TaxID=3986 RepID=UPI00216023FE|nr:anthocyanidin reductase ((2S)-flavan-3-ol-forming)-like [Mercurialis annua]
MNCYPKVCVTGGSGYIGSWLINKLLHRGYTVHATLRNLKEASKVDLLKSFPNAESNLVLFEADLDKNNDFEEAIHGCEFVFHIATPKSSQYKDKAEATVAGAKNIVESCIRSKTVKRLIYTATVLAASPLNEDGNSFKCCMDESCWTPLDLSFSCASDHNMGYTKGKTLAEKEVLRYNNMKLDGANFEVVTLALGLVGGDTLTSHVPSTIQVICSPISGNVWGYNHGLRFLQQVLGSIPIVHVDDVCEAHIFCMENSEAKGRFLCAVANPTSRDIALYYQQHYPQFKIDDRFMGETEEEIKFDSSKLSKLGFDYKYDLKKILDESLECGKRLGEIFLP